MRSARVSGQPLLKPLMRSLACGLALAACASCGTTTPPAPERFKPGAQEARRALEQALEAWHASPALERTVTKIQPVMFVDQQRRPGQELRAFTVLGESVGAEAYRTFRVKLSLANPDESALVSYYVFGQGQIWVYRSEDLDMIMHMDHSMMAASAPGADFAGGDDRTKPTTGHPHDGSAAAASKHDTGAEPMP